MERDVIAPWAALAMLHLMWPSTLCAFITYCPPENIVGQTWESGRHLARRRVIFIQAVFIDKHVFCCYFHSKVHLTGDKDNKLPLQKISRVWECTQSCRLVLISDKTIHSCLSVVFLNDRGGRMDVTSEKQNSSARQCSGESRLQDHGNYDPQPKQKCHLPLFSKIWYGKGSYIFL